MEFVNVDKFLPYVLPYAEKCPQLVARRAVRDTIIDIAHRTGSSTVRCSMETVKGQNVYEFELPNGLDTELLLSVNVGNAPLQAITRDTLSQLYPNTDWRKIAGNPRYYFHTDSSRVLCITPAPSEDGQTISCEMRVRFARDNDEFPKEYFDRYLETVASGALSRILAMPAQSFTDLGMAAQWAQMYARYLEEIRSDVVRDFTKSAGRVVYRSIL